MKQLTIYISLFCIALSIPLGYFILLAYRNIQQEEKAELQHFVTLLFDDMEEELIALLRREEARPLDEYSYYRSVNPLTHAAEFSRSPLSQPPEEPYLLGYFQNNPDGSFQTPLQAPDSAPPEEWQPIIDRLEVLNAMLNHEPQLAKKQDTRLAEQQQSVVSPAPQTESSAYAEKYLDLSKLRSRKEELTRQSQTAPPITVEQLANVMQRETFQDLQSRDQQTMTLDLDTAQVSVEPLQAMLVNDQEILLLRRIHINQQVYRQALVIRLRELLKHLRTTYLAEQPLTKFVNVRLEINDHERRIAVTQAGVTVRTAIVTFQRTFPSPFDFLTVIVTCDQLPSSASRNTLNLMRLLIGVIILAGLFAIYQGTRAVVELSERRALFVSSVTHELKTPLTTLRMYSEMLEQGIAPSREREMEYFRVLRSESERLTRLIQNVLDFAKLEKHRQAIHLQEGTFEDVIQEAQRLMRATLRQQGFALHVDYQNPQTFRYDRDIMVQVVMNLLENSVKFGKTSSAKEITLTVRFDKKRVNISVADTGPGIPRKALKKVFDDFYRGDHELTRTTSGTGLGLALVKRGVTAHGGTVNAVNNKGQGCTITISLPAGGSGYKDVF